jgi:uncharacterized repeat protein (TIGR01451 family)
MPVSTPSRCFAFLALLALLLVPAAGAQVSLSTTGVPVTQNFDGLANTGTNITWTDNSTIAGWYSTRVAYNSGTGSSNAGALYSFGAASAADRALGGIGSGGTGTFYWAVRLVNNTGNPLSSLDISYMGEQWRDGGAATPVAQTMVFEYQVATAGTITDADTPSTGWTAFTSLDFTSPVFVNTATGAAVDGNVATTLRSANLAVAVAAGQEIWLRWRDVNDGGNDHGLAVDTFSVTANGGPPANVLNVNDVTLAEGNAGTTSFFFTVSLSAPAGPGGVTFDIATADGTAQDDNPATEDNDYVAKSLTGQTIPAGSSTYAFSVDVNGDTSTEPNETFFVNVTNITGANAGDVQGLGTINNDDVTLTPIHDIQGPGNSSPIVGASITTSGIVTGVKSNGFYIQEPDASVDADPATSEGVFVFTSSAPPAAAAVGNQVQVAGTVVEFVPTADTLQPPLTEISSPTVTQLSTGNPLPAAIPLTASFPSPAGPFDQLERVEGMRVSMASMTVNGGTLGNISEANATATSTGVFFGVVTGLPRAFREPGIQAPDPPPTGTIPPIPRWDTNPEVVRVDSDALTGTTAVDVGAGAVVTGLVGPLDYTFRRYTILPENPLTVVGGPTLGVATAPLGNEVTVAGFNLQRFYDTANDPATSDVVLTAGAFDNRLNKASLAIRNHLLMPDIVGVVEMENLTTLQALAARISADAIAASQPDPDYDSYLVEGNDIGGIDVGYLVKTAVVTGSTPRVSVISVTQELDGSLLVNPDSSTDVLNDRPPLVLEAEVNHANGTSYPLVVIINHLRSLNDAESNDPGANGWPTAGARVRAKRQQQAEDLANYIQGRQVADPTENQVILGDFNAFEFNDGYGDSMNTITGTPPPDNQTVVIGDGADLVNPDLDNLFDTVPPADRYSYVFDGMAQSLDHVVVNAALIASTTARRLEHPRVNADFPETAKNNSAVATRIADHDPVVTYFTVAGFASADLSITKTDSPDPVVAGTNLTYTITVTNSGPDPASTVEWTDTLPAGTTFVSLPAVGGWSCTTPAVGAGGTVECSMASVPVGSSVFTLTVAVANSVAVGTVLTNTATVSSTTADVDSGDLSATAITTTLASADVSVTKTDSPDPVTAGQNLTYTITVTNDGPSVATTVTLNDPLPAGTTFVSLPAVGGWSCTTPAVGAGGSISCSTASLGITSAVFTLTVAVDPAVAAGTLLSNTAVVTTSTPDPDGSDQTATATTTVATQADLAITKVASPDPVGPGQDLTFTLTVNNNGPSAASTVALADTLPAGTSFQSLVAPAGWSCTTPAVDSGGTVNCSIASLGLGNAVFTLVTEVGASVAGGTTITNTATVSSTTADPDSGDLSATDTALVLAGASVSASKSVSGDFSPGGFIEYTVILTNAGPSTQGDNPTDEMVDVLPPELVLIDATATSGTAVATVGTNTVTWNGSIPALGTVTITITAQIDPGLTNGDEVLNQAIVHYDQDGNGDNEASAVSDDPGVAGGGDPTVIVVGGVPPVEIPTIDLRGILALVALLSAAALFKLRR